MQTSLTYLRFGIFALSTWYIIKNDKRFIKYYLYCFLIVFLSLEIDGIYQYINKENLFGYKLLLGQYPPNKSVALLPGK